MLSIYLKYYFFYLLALALLYALGKSFLFACRRHFNIRGGYANIFASLTIGTVLFITVYSCLMTGFKTVNLGFILMFLFLVRELFFKKKIIQPEFFAEKKLRPPSLIPELIILTFILFSSEALFLLNSSAFHFTIPPVDDILYSNISESIKLTGQENVYTTGNLFSSKFHGMVAYHYFELWLNAGIAGIFGLINICSQLMITYPVFYFIGLLGIFSIWEHYKNITFFHKLLSLCLLMTGGVYMHFLEGIPFYERTRIFSKFPLELLSKKVSDLYVFGFASILLFLNKKDMLAVICLLCMGIVSVTILPAVLGGLVIYLSICFFLKKYTAQFYRRALGYVLLTTAFIAALYYFGGNRSLQIIREDELFKLSLFSDKIYLKNFIYIIAAYPLLSFLSYLPMTCILVFLIFRYEIPFYKLPTRFLLFAACVFIVGLISCAFYNSLHDSFALYMLPTSVVFGLLGTLIVIACLIYIDLKISERLKYIYGTLFLMVLLFPVYSNVNFYRCRINKTDNGYCISYLKKVETLVKEKVRNPVGVCLLNKSRIPVIAHTNSYLNIRGEYLKFSKAYYTTVTLSLMDTDSSYQPGDLKKVKKLQSYSVFFNFIEDQKKTNSFQSIEQSQLDFIEKNHIDYLVAEADAAISSLILNKATEIVEDPVSRDRFILLAK